MLGVLVALGLESIVTRTGEVSEERAYLEQLVADLAETERLMLEAETLPANSFEGVDELILAIQTQSAVSDDAIRTGVLRSGSFNNPVPIFSAADALLARARLRLLDPGDRSAIAAWLSYSRDFHLEPLYQVEELFREKRYSLMSRAGIPSDVTPPPGEVERLPVDQSLQHLLSDPETYALLHDVRDLRQRMGLYRSDMARVARELRTRLEEIL